jgi:acyl-CoA reductase-like NAD-dependent aldehyde dehydrogenase
MKASSRFDGRLLVAGKRMEGPSSYELKDPYRGEVLATVNAAGVAEVERAVRAARAAQPLVAGMAVHQRAAILRDAVSLIHERRDVLATTITRQTGKAVRDARREVDRSTYTLAATAGALEELYGEVAPADAIPGGEGLIGLVLYEPLGIVAAITPFNAPLNIPMHKVAPALAAGNAVVLKPAPQAPISAFQLAEILIEAGMPSSSISVLPGGAEAGSALVSHPDVDFISFTGGRATGELIARSAGVKGVVLELGGNSPNIVHADANIPWTARALALGAFSNSGQSCNSVQRVIAHESVAEELSDQLVAEARSLNLGDPLADTTDVGTLVDEAAAVRVSQWIEDAVQSGARLRSGGNQEGAALAPTVLDHVTPRMRIVCEEVFGPVLTISTYADLEEAIALANDTVFGLQSAVFTNSLSVAFETARRLRTGGVMVNRSSNFRLDNMPFGGTRGSGNGGREGARYTLREMCNRKLLLVDAFMRGAPHPLAATPRTASRR